MDNYIGFLSPDGIFFSCEHYQHIYKAKDLVSMFYCKDMNGVAAEDFLFENGWCIFYARGFGWRSFQSHVNEPLTKEQKYFILDSIESCQIDEKVEQMKFALKVDDRIRNTPKVDYCLECGAHLDGTFRYFCPNCGTQLYE